MGLKDIDYKEFIDMAENNKFKISNINYKKLIRDMHRVSKEYPDIKKSANLYILNDLIELFDKLNTQYDTIIDIETYLDEYMKIVEYEINNNNSFTQSLTDAEREVYTVIMKLRGYSAYRSSLSEISLALIAEDEYGKDFDVVHSDTKLDSLLGVDVALISKTDDSAHYIHVTKESKYALAKIESKAKKYTTVIDTRIEETSDSKFVFRQYRRDFKDHILAVYNEHSINNKVVNGCFIFHRDYIRALIEDNKGKCNRSQYDDLEYIEESPIQIRTTYDKAIIKF